MDFEDELDDVDIDVSTIITSIADEVGGGDWSKFDSSGSCRSGNILSLHVDGKVYRPPMEISSAGPSLMPNGYMMDVAMAAVLACRAFLSGCTVAGSVLLHAFLNCAVVRRYPHSKTLGPVCAYSHPSVAMPSVMHPLIGLSKDPVGLHVALGSRAGAADPNGLRAFAVLSHSSPTIALGLPIGETVPESPEMSFYNSSGKSQVIEIVNLVGREVSDIVKAVAMAIGGRAARVASLLGMTASPNNFSVLSRMRYGARMAALPILNSRRWALRCSEGSLLYDALVSQGLEAARSLKTIHGSICTFSVTSEQYHSAIGEASMAISTEAIAEAVDGICTPQYVGPIISAVEARLVSTELMPDRLPRLCSIRTGRLRLDPNAVASSFLAERHPELSPLLVLSRPDRESDRVGRELAEAAGNVTDNEAEIVSQILSVTRSRVSHSGSNTVAVLPVSSSGSLVQELLSAVCNRSGRMNQLLHLGASGVANFDPEVEAARRLAFLIYTSGTSSVTLDDCETALKTWCSGDGPGRRKAAEELSRMVSLVASPLTCVPFRVFNVCVHRVEQLGYDVSFTWSYKDYKVDICIFRTEGTYRNGNNKAVLNKHLPQTMDGHDTLMNFLSSSFRVPVNTFARRGSGPFPSLIARCNGLERMPTRGNTRALGGDCMRHDGIFHLSFDYQQTLEHIEPQVNRFGVNGRVLSWYDNCDTLYDPERHKIIVRGRVASGSVDAFSIARVPEPGFLSPAELSFSQLETIEMTDEVMRLVLHMSVSEIITSASALTYPLGNLLRGEETPPFVLAMRVVSEGRVPVSLTGIPMIRRNVSRQIAIPEAAVAAYQILSAQPEQLPGIVSGLSTLSSSDNQYLLCILWVRWLMITRAVSVPPLSQQGAALAIKIMHSRCNTVAVRGETGFSWL